MCMPTSFPWGVTMLQDMCMPTSFPCGITMLQDMCMPTSFPCRITMLQDMCLPTSFPWGITMLQVAAYTRYMWSYGYFIDLYAKYLCRYEAESDTLKVMKEGEIPDNWLPISFCLYIYSPVLLSFCETPKFYFSTLVL